MKNTTRQLYLSAVLLLLLISCAQNDTSKESESDIAGIEEFQQQYINAVEAGDLDKFINTFEESAIRMEPGFQDIIGRDKIRQHFQTTFDSFEMKVALYGEKKIEISENIAFSHVNFIISLRAKGTDSTNYLDGKTLEIYKRQTDGSWKIHIQHMSPNPVWSDDIPPPEILKKLEQSDPLL